MTRPSRKSLIFILVTAVVALWVQAPVAQVDGTEAAVKSIGPGSLAAPKRSEPTKTATTVGTALGPQNTLSFPGIGDTGATPPSPSIAVGPNYLIQVVNRTVEIRNKNGDPGIVNNFDQFPWDSFDLTGSKAPFDPSVIYDQFADRWAMLALNKDTANGVSYFLLAASKTQNPLGLWCSWRIRADTIGNTPSGTWADNGQLGFDDTNFYITSNQHNFSNGAFVQARVLLMGKNQFYNCSSSYEGFDFSNLAGAPTSVVPARTFGSPGKGYLVDAESPISGAALRIRTITGTWPNATNTVPVLAASTSVTVAAYTAPIDAPSLGSTTPIDTGDSRLLNVVYRGGYLYTAHTVGTPCFDPATSSCARFYRISVSGAPTISIQESVGTASLFSFYPAIEPDPSGNIFLAFSRTGPSQYAESRYALRLTTDSATQASQQLQAGLAPYTRLDGGINRWGTHGGAAVDPSDGTVWVTHQFAWLSLFFGDWWGTTIARLSVALPGAFNRIAPANGSTNQPVSPTLQWAASANAANYEICFDTTNDNACSNWFPVFQTTATLTDLAPATTYYWHVRAVNANGVTYANGSSATYWSFTTGIPPAPFGKVSPANGSTVASGNVTLSWQPSAGATSYSYCFFRGGQPCNLASVGNNTSVTVIASPAEFYNWRVVATNAAGPVEADSGVGWFMIVSGPVNDWFAGAKVITTLPYQDGVDTFDATNTSEDPPMSCGAGPNKSVWYTYTPTIDGPVTFNTFGSAYDTVLAVYTGSPGSFSQVLCSDDSYSSQMPQSSLTVLGFAGVRLSILVASYWLDDGGGSLTLNAFRPTRRLEVQLDSNGQSDVLSYDPATGAWIRQLSQGGNGFSVQSQGTWDAGLSVSPGRFDTDGLTDFFLFNTATGAWSVMLNNGTTFTKAAEGGWWPGWQRHIMDLNGDGVSDVFLYDPTTGAWFMCQRKPTGFNYFQGGWNPGWELYPMVLNNDSSDDLFLISRTTGRWFWVQSSGGGNFNYPFTETWFSGWNLYPGDFNGDGRSDLLLHDPATGVYFVATNTGAGFTYTQGGWSLGWTPYVADFNADGREDLFLHDPQTGVWFEMMSDGAGHFTNGGGQIWSLGWRMTPTDLNGDRRVDMVLYDPATGTWYQARNTSNGVFAYKSGGWAPQLMLITRAPFR